MESRLGAEPGGRCAHRDSRVPRQADCDVFSSDLDVAIYYQKLTKKRFFSLKEVFQSTEAFRIAFVDKGIDKGAFDIKYGQH